MARCPANQGLKNLFEMHTTSLLRTVVGGQRSLVLAELYQDQTMLPWMPPNLQQPSTTSSINSSNDPCVQTHQTSRKISARDPHLEGLDFCPNQRWFSEISRTASAPPTTCRDSVNMSWKAPWQKLRTFQKATENPTTRRPDPHDDEDDVQNNDDRATALAKEGQLSKRWVQYVRGDAAYFNDKAQRYGT